MHKVNYEGDSKVIKRLCEMVNEIIDRGEGSIADLDDVELTDLSNDDILKYDATEEKWVNAEDAGGVDEFSQLTDVNLTDLADGQIPKYNATTQKWENADESGGTTVSITPTLSSGTKIADFEIDGTAGSLYAPNGGGGGTGRYEQTELFTSATPVNSGTLNLSDDISNYDVLCFEYALVGSYGRGDNSLSYKYVDAKYFIEAFPNTATRETDHLIIDGYDNFYLYAKMGNADNKIDVWNVGSPNTGVLKVFGIKCGSGEGSFDKTILYEGTDVIGSLQSHITLNDAWDNYDMLEVVAFYAGASTYSDYVSPEALTKAQLMGNDRACALATYATSSCACYHLNANHKDMDIFGTNSNNIWKIYGIKFGGGGTDVEANPSEEPTDELNTIRIGNTVYEIVGGGSGGSGFSEETLYEGTASQATYTLSKPISKFDMIRVLGTYFDTYSGKQLYFTNLYSVNALISAIGTTDSFGLANDSQYTYFIISSETQFTRSIEQTIYICGVYGVKFGSSGGGGEQSVDLIYEASSTSIVDVTTTESMTDYDYIIIEADERGGTYINTCILLKEEVEDAITNGKTVTPAYLNDNYRIYCTIDDDTTITLTSALNMYIRKVYGVKGGGGVDVEANPTDEPTDELSTIRIGDTVYDIAGGGGSSKAYSRTVLYDTGVALPAQVTLADDITNYDILEIVITYEQINKGKTSYFYDAKKFVQDFPYVASPDSYNTPHFVISDYYPQYSRFIMGDENNKLWCYQSNYGYLVEVAGLKFNGGSQGGSGLEIITEHFTGGTGTTSRTFTLPDDREPSWVRVKGYTDGNWHADMQFRWGDTTAYAITDDRHPYNSSYTFNDNITYADNTFTLVAYNAGCAFNSATANFDVDYIYNEGGGGTEVIANPEGEATDELTKIQIGEDIYEIVGGGAGGDAYEETILFEDTTTPTTGQITLSDSLDNYDLMIITASYSGSDNKINISDICSTAEFMRLYPYVANPTYANANHFMLTTNTLYMRVIMGDANNKIYPFQSDSLRITQVVGLKFKGGSGGGGGEFKDDILWSGSSVQNVYDLSHNISDYDFIYFKAYYVDGGTHCSSSAMFLASELMASAGDNSVQFDISDEQHYFYFYADDETHINKGSWVNALIIEEIHGIKTGGSGGSSGGGDVYERTELFKSATPQSGVISLSDAIDNYDDIEIVMGWVTSSDTASHTERFNAEYFVTNFPYVASPSNENPHALLEMWASQGFSCAVGDATNTALQTWGHNGSPAILAVYGIKYGSGGGTAVEANPSEEPTDTLTTIKIGDTVYDIEGAGGSGYEATLIYDGSALSSLQSSIELDDRWDNYDALYLTFKFGGDDGSTFGNLLLKEQLEEALNHTYTAIGSYTQNYVGAHIVNDYKTFNQIYGGGNVQQNIYAVYGLKFGSGGGTGGGSSTEVVSIAAGDGTSTRTFTFAKKPKFVHIWYTVPDKWSMSEDIFWGQPWGVYDCTNGNAPYAGGAQGSNTITFDDTTLTMTLTGVNALGCANNSNGYGYMWVDYGEGGGSSQEEYSTTEKVIGKWINGKPLYQKTVYSATLGTGQIVPVAHGISNLGVVVGVEATCFDGGYENAWFPISHISTDGYNIGIFSVDGTNINFSNPTAFGSRITEVYATIKYTKSTD